MFEDHAVTILFVQHVAPVGERCLCQRVLPLAFCCRQICQRLTPQTTHIIHDIIHITHTTHIIHITQITHNTINTHNIHHLFCALPSFVHTHPHGASQQAPDQHPWKTMLHTQSTRHGQHTQRGKQCPI